MIRVELPYHLRHLADAPAEVELSISGPVTTAAILDSLEQIYPSLRGTIRDHVTLLRRPFLRFFACGEDVTHQEPGSLLPPQIANGTEPFIIIGAIAGG